LTPLLLIGGGGHCRSCIDVIETSGEFEIIGIIDRSEKIGEKVLGYPVLGCDDDLEKMRTKSSHALLTVGQIRSPAPRKRLAGQCVEAGYEFPIIVSPHAVVSRHATLGEGTIVMHGAIVNAGAKIGHHAILNSKSLVEHDATLSGFVHISTGATVNGGVSIGEGAFLGSGCTTREYTEVSEGAVIPAGSAYMEGRRLDPA
jgi:sugar O-acyltransferase (sialic acid O-acetyltransferase NeuD family)